MRQLNTQLMFESFPRAASSNPDANGVALLEPTDHSRPLSPVAMSPDCRQSTHFIILIVPIG